MCVYPENMYTISVKLYGTWPCAYENILHAMSSCSSSTSGTSAARALMLAVTPVEIAC